MAGVIRRRVHVPQLRRGEIELDPAAARHVRSVLRLTVGTAVEAFDDAGAVATGVIVRLEPAVVVRVAEVVSATTQSTEIVIAAAVPKGDRADWMVEKLSELGCHRFVPLATARSVVLPEGRNKRDRWVRLATESAKQSRRSGVMRIDELTPLKAAVDALSREDDAAAFHLSTDPSADPILDALADARNVTLFIGPEGGWTDEEVALFATRDVRGLKLTTTILRVETAAVAAASIAAVTGASASNRKSQP
jgi:16S rRNA (uracil1498-N3)-methyltransferase